MSRSHALRGALGPMVRDGAPVEAVEEVKRELKAEVAADYIRRLVDSAPPLSEEQRARLAALLLPVRRPRAGARAA